MLIVDISSLAMLLLKAEFETVIVDYVSTLIAPTPLRAKL